jgi:integration host factor subunit alpha
MLGHVLRFNEQGRAGMTKADLARMVYERHGGMTNRDAARYVDLLFDLIKRHLVEGESIHIVGFGTLEVVSRKPRPGRNPITGERIELSARRALVFRPSRSMRSV